MLYLSSSQSKNAVGISTNGIDRLWLLSLLCNLAAERRAKAGARLDGAGVVKS